MMKLISFLITATACFCAVACKQKEAKRASHTLYTSRVYQTELDQFGYDIYKGRRLVIHQPIIPGIAGNIGFDSKNKAQKTADLIIYKLNNGITPPSITLHELDSLRVR